MGRDKNYDRTELLNRAVELFWLKGFHATSTVDLVEALGVHRKSLYAEFGSKQGLFEAALEHYSNNHLNHLLASIEGDTAAKSGLNAIKAIFKDLANAAEGTSYGMGCLLCNAASERASLDPAVGPYIDTYIERIQQNFLRILNDAKKNKTLKKNTRVEHTASFLTSSILGVVTGIRAKAPAEQAWGTYYSVSAVVDQLLIGP